MGERIRNGGMVGRWQQACCNKRHYVGGVHALSVTGEELRKLEQSGKRKGVIK